MEQAIQMNIGGIKCDTPECDFRDDLVTLEDYPNWLNKPCPKCKGNLLTQADYDNVHMMVMLVNMLNKSQPPADPTEEKAVLRVETNGTGSMTMEIKEYKEEEDD